MIKTGGGISELLKKKKCKSDSLKFCTDGRQIGNCIPSDRSCAEHVKKPKFSKFKFFLLNKNKKQITVDNYKFKKRIKYPIRYKLSDHKSNIENYTNHLIKINIKKTKKFMGSTEYDDISHTKIYNKNNIELLAWLLAGLHNLDKHEDRKTSFIKYYFSNKDSHLVVPILRESDKNSLEITDGRHRLGFYNYFNINGYILTTQEGRDILHNNNLILKEKLLDISLLKYFSSNVFTDIYDIDIKELLIDAEKPKRKKTVCYKRKCPKCGQGQHPIYRCPRRVQIQQVNVEEE